ncbi:peptidoglycan recognition family protein [Actinocorallia sp. A-T 12471]|uniref:peptidoglycan recognition family protein n=1 Tax=Actinocorallia sp. A-T 12471 TaxID=3089813 RepID=UPI0029CF0D78|nr:peptidoglycan recognition family protein [Actinocorallia sp. A-T 12471]MDX6742209.1 peptidoglycan recognition family protein [Actinocorallia sp. A-T 12471]
MAYPYIGALKHGGKQGRILRIVIHATVSPCVRGGARNVARYFQSSNAGGSAHYVVDPGEIVQCVRDDVVAYHAPPNTGTLGIELCDPQAGSPKRWDDDNHKAMLVLGAKLVRELAAKHDVPLVRVNAAQLRAGRRGICSHVAVSDAFGQTDHGDPEVAGPFPWAKFMQLITEGEDDMPSPKEIYDAVWKRDVMPSPADDPKNPTWQAESVLTDVNKKVRVLQDQVTGLKSELASTNAKLDQVLKLLRAGS